MIVAGTLLDIVEEFIVGARGTGDIIAGLLACFCRLMGLPLHQLREVILILQLCSFVCFLVKSDGW